MIHVGDITKLNGADLEPVNVIVGGSPCQDLSVAGKRAGLAGERSGLFLEQIRVIKEMRKADEATGRTDVTVRWGVWENVPGALSSGTPKGEDFRIVLEEFCRVKDPDAVVPGPPKGKWPNSGCILGEGYSVAWRVHDAQWFGVPQRRRRVALAADFDGHLAPGVLFDPQYLGETSDTSTVEAESDTGAAPRSEVRPFTESVCGDLEQGETEGEGTAAPTESSTGAAECFGISAYDSNAMKSANPHSGIYKADTARTLVLNDQGGSVMGISHDVTGALRAQEHGHQPLVCAGFKAGQSRAGGLGWEEERAATLSSQCSGLEPTVYDAREPVCIEMTSTKNTIVEDGISPTLTARMGTGGNQVNAVLEATNIFGDEVSPTLVSPAFKGPGNTQDGYCVCADVAHSLKAKANCDFRMDSETYVATALNPCVDSVVRRLTPRECERLQAFPDDWTNIGEWTDSKGKVRKTSDSNRYKVLGNSIALPFWHDLLQAIRATYPDDYTPKLGSLFDGIGGFPLCWERICGKGTARWASEIEEFPIAVTKKHFPEE